MGVFARDSFVMCNSNLVAEAAQLWEADGIKVRYDPKNPGTCKSWNDAARQSFAMGYRGVLILNDDVILQDDDAVKRIEALIEARPLQLLAIGSLGFSGFIMTPALVEAVGYFDEGYYPAYFDDNDYHRRIILEGNIPCNGVDVATSHTGSGSLKSWKAWETWNATYAFPTNQRRFTEKWGGLPETPTYIEPWNGYPTRAWDTKTWLRQYAKEAPPWGWWD
jgi:GT2 family glycosyltransferase